MELGSGVCGPESAHGIFEAVLLDVAPGAEEVSEDIDLDADDSFVCRRPRHGSVVEEYIAPSNQLLPDAIVLINYKNKFCIELVGVIAS